MERSGYLLTAGLFVCLLGLTTATYTQEVSDGQVRSEVTFRARTVAVSFVPIAAEDDPMHRALLSGDSDARVHVGQLEAFPLLRIGTIEPELPASPGDGSGGGQPPAEQNAQEGGSPFALPPPVTFDLWLSRAGQGWELQTDKGNIPLTHQTVQNSADTFAAAVIPTTGSTGRPQLKWGRHEWSTDFDFVDPPRSPGAARRALAALTGARTRETDTRPAARIGTLFTSNETAVVLPDASRVSILFWRGVEAKADKGFGLVESTADGEVLMLTHAPVIRLKNEVPLQFKGVSLPTGNLAPGIPGAYGLWLKKSGSGWRLVFNNEPDSWGSQHDPLFDVGEIELRYRGDGDASRPLGVALVPATAHAGSLVLQWGAHEWSADFSIGS